MYALYKWAQLLLQPDLWIAGLTVAALISSVRRRETWSRRLLATAVAMLFVFGTRPVNELLLRPLERRYPPVAGALERHDAIVVLGGGARWEPGIRRGTVLGTPGVDRLVRGLELLGDDVASMMVVAGGIADPEGKNPGEGETMREIALSIGADPARVQVDARSRTTSENAAEVARMLPPGAKVALVSSAVHLPRAAALFRKRGLTVTPVPADYLAPERDWGVGDLLLPRAGRLVTSEAAIHEYVGIAAYRILGRL